MIQLLKYKAHPRSSLWGGMFLGAPEGIAKICTVEHVEKRCQPVIHELWSRVA